MTEMNLPTKQKLLRHREQTCGCQQQWVGGQGEVMGEMEWEVRLADANYYIQNGETTRSYCIAQ